MFWPCFQSEEKKIARMVSDEIDRSLRRAKREASNELKLLLLGTGESGKSTFIKQMRIINGDGYREHERRKFAALVYQNVFTAVRVVLKSMQLLGVPFENPDRCIAYAGLITGVDPSKVTRFEEPYAEAIKELLLDSGVQQVLDRRWEVHLPDSALYYLTSLSRIADPAYIPSQQDILRIRVPTTGIVEYVFDINKNARFRMVDVGGQRGERSKWIHCFEGVCSILFLVALSEYDQVLVEAKDKINRLEESRALFTTILMEPIFSETSIILFMNKTDIFKEKITYSPLRRHFPDYEGPEGCYDSARNFVADMFREDNKLAPNKLIYTHFTCATDTENMSFIFTAVKDTLLSNNIKQYHLD